uniref:Uncharacterized protein n=1 Tax=Aegilops tauschii subsp. strangulata TaxID=200361 RepID=A0A453F2T7_AEGTS
MFTCLFAWKTIATDFSGILTEIIIQLRATTGPSRPTHPSCVAPAGDGEGTLAVAGLPPTYRPRRCHTAAAAGLFIPSRVAPVRAAATGQGTVIGGSRRCSECPPGDDIRWHLWCVGLLAGGACLPPLATKSGAGCICRRGPWVARGRRPLWVLDGGGGWSWWPDEVRWLWLCWRLLDVPGRWCVLGVAAMNLSDLHRGLVLLPTHGRRGLWGGVGYSSPVALGAGDGTTWWCAPVGCVQQCGRGDQLDWRAGERVCGGGDTHWWLCPVGGAAQRMRPPFSSVYAVEVAMIGGTCSGGFARGPRRVGVAAPGR